MPKYQIQDISQRLFGQDAKGQRIDVSPATQVGLYKDKVLIAVFTDGFNSRTDAQKVCDLLNETSRSQGKQFCNNTIPGRGFADVSFCIREKGHEGSCR